MMARSRILHALVLFTGSLDRVSGHGAVVSPPPRNAVDKDLAPWNGPVSASHGSKVPPIHFPSDFMTILNPSPICKANYFLSFGPRTVSAKVPANPPSVESKTGWCPVPGKDGNVSGQNGQACL